MKLQLFTGPQCHLCDDAKAVLAQYDHYFELDITQCNIRDNTDWYHLYAIRIPVVKRVDNGQELGWPFTLSDVEAFLQ